MLNFSKLQIFLSAFIASIILIVLAFYYNQFETSSIQKEKYEYLNAVVNLKKDQISKWKNERLSEAKFFPGVGRLVRSTVFLQKDITDKDARNYLVETLLPIKERHYYKNILIIDNSGKVLFSLDSSRTYADSVTVYNSKIAVKKDSIFISDFYFCSSHSEIHLDIYSPIKDNNKKIIAIFVLQIDPREYLFPMIMKWPTPSRSAETLIYRKEGNAVRLLTSGKSLRNDSLNIVIPFERSDYVSIKGILNQGGVIEGVDYKNSEVIAAISPIEETDWYLISKVDKDEIYEDLFFKTWTIIILLFVSILLIFVTAMYLYRLRQSEIYKSLFYKERELYETQEIYKTTLYSIGDAVITTDANGNIKNMNSVAEKLTGWKESESYGKKLKEVFRVINEDSNLEVENPVTKVLQSNSVVGLANHTLLITKDGRSIPISDSVSPIKDDKGNVIGVVLVFRDQTEERTKERSILESNDKFTKIFNSSSESISLTQMSSGNLKEINDGFIEMFGYSRDEVIDKSTLDLGLWVYPSDRERMIEEIKSTGRIKNFEATGRRKNGEYIIALISGELVNIDNEKMLLLTIRDITDRKKFEAVLKNERDRISAILNLVGDPIFVKDDQHRFTLGNKAFFEMIGLEENKVIGKTLAENIPEDEMKHFLEVDRLVLDTGITDTREEQLTINNQTRTIITSKTRFTDESGERLVIGSMHDITDRVNAEKEKAHFNDLMKYIISNTKSSVSVFDASMNYIYVSDRYFDDFHLADKNIIGCNHYDVFPDLPQFLRDIHKRALNGETISGEGDPFLHQDGSMDWANWTCMPWYNTDGTIGGIIVYIEVITERKKAEEQIKLLAQMVAIAPGAILVHNFEGQIHYANQRAAEMYGCTNEEYMKLTLRDIDSIENAELFHIRMEDLINNGEINFEGKHRRKDGSAYPVQVFAKKIEWADKPAILSITTDITDRKIFEEKQKASEEKFKMLLDFAPDAFFHGDSKGNFITVNNHACELSGFSREDLLRMNMKDLFPKEILDSNPLQYDALKAGQTRKTERIILRNDGKKIFVEMISKQMPDGTYQSFFRDLTEQKKTEKEFEEAEERFRKAFITSPDSININRLSDGKYVSINAGFTRMTGYEEQEVIGKTSAEIQIWADVKYRNELVALLSKNSLVANLEAKFRMKDGSIKDGLMSAAVIELKGEPHIISITRDISDSKKLMNEIMESEEKFRSIWDSSIDAMRLIDEKGTIINVNQSYCNLFGLRKEELIGNVFNVSYIIRDKDKSLVGFEDRFKNRTIQKKFETEIQLRNGQMIWVELTNSFIEHEDKNPMLLSIIRDITDRKKLITQLTESKTKAEEMVKLKSYFFANMSHELRTPFVGILGFAEILKDTLQNPNEREYAEQILKSSKRLTDTLNKILNVTRLEFDKVDIKLNEFDLVKMLKDVESLYSNSAKINKTIISTVTEEKSIKIKSDAKLLEDILNNLVNNAVKFTHNGSIKLSASKITFQNNPGIKIIVEDTGIGIPAEKQNLVWQEFRQASEGLNRSFEGTGLGLTISKKYVELLGGSISLQSEERKGSVFTISLPLNLNLVSTVTDKTVAKSDIKPLAQKQTSGKPKILYVEDDIVALQFINIVLKSGFNVDTAFSANEALEKVAIKKYDTLMLDINLGSGMDGLELMQKIRENSYYKNIPVVAVTAYAAESDKTEFLAKGFNYYISKPFTQKELFKLLNEIFSSK